MILEAIRTGVGLCLGPRLRLIALMNHFLATTYENGLTADLLCYVGKGKLLADN